MSKNLLSIISGTLGVSTILGALIWAYTAADENGTVHLEGNENYAYLFLALGILSLITGSIALRATNEQGDRISKKAIFSGLALAVFFFIWRLSVTL